MESRCCARQSYPLSTVQGHLGQNGVVEYKIATCTILNIVYVTLFVCKSCGCIGRVDVDKSCNLLVVIALKGNFLNNLSLALKLDLQPSANTF